MADVESHIPFEQRPECQRYHEISRTTLATIRQLSDQELERRVDELMTIGRPDNCPQIFDWQLSPGDYSDELNRRAVDRRTRSVTRLSIVATVATVVAALPILSDVWRWLLELLNSP